jgi:flavodoxin
LQPSGAGYLNLCSYPLFTNCQTLYNLLEAVTMKSLLVYDSQFGNTQKIAQSMGEVLKECGESILVRVGDFKWEMLSGVDLLLVGSPTQGFKPTDAIREFLKGTTTHPLNGKRVAAFDTRFTQEHIDRTPVLPFLVKKFGYAAGSIGKALQKGGGLLVAPAEPFYVLETEGPLLEGELERAAEWARKLFT